MEKVRVGIIGTGGMARGHIGTLLEIPDAEITALCDIRPEQIEATVAKYPALAGVPRFGDFRELIASGLVDAAHIDTPHTTHYEQIMGCLDAGLHVFCEKPMTCEVSHAHDVLRKIKQTGRVFVLGYQRSYMSQFLYVRNRIATGEFGPVQFVQGLQCQGWLKGCAGSWRHDPKYSGGGQLNDSGSHLLSVLLFMTGLSVDRVFAYIENFNVPVDINSAISLVFAGGAQGNITIVGNAPTWHEDITIWCENGAYFLRQGKLEICGPDGKRFEPEIAEMPVRTNPDSNLINAILGKEPVGSEAVWGLRVIELTEAAWQSAKENRPVEVKHVPLP